MTLKEANNKVEKLENDLKYYLNEKELLELKVGLKSTDTSKEKLDQQERKETILEYITLKEIKDLDNKIVITQEQMQNLVNWINNELKILSKYNQIEQLVRYYKEDIIVNNPGEKPRNMTWHEISYKVNYSITQCRNIYRRYKKTRDI